MGSHQCKIYSPWTHITEYNVNLYVPKIGLVKGRKEIFIFESLNPLCIWPPHQALLCQPDGHHYMLGLPWLFFLCALLLLTQFLPRLLVFSYSCNLSNSLNLSSAVILSGFFKRLFNVPHSRGDELGVYVCNVNRVRVRIETVNITFPKKVTFHGIVRTVRTRDGSD